jgi:hypothetical protein
MSPLPHNSAPSTHAGVTGSERRTLEALFAHPISRNLAWIDVVALVGRIGSVEERSDAVFALRIGNETLDTDKPHTKHLSAPEVIDLRHFLDRAGWRPEARGEPEDISGVAAPSAPAPSLIVVVDHHETRVYHVELGANDPARHAITLYDSQHLLHNVVHETRRPDKRANPEEDREYYELIAGALAKGGLIVVVGHGKGESNAGHELAKFLREHDPLTYRRIVREVVADLPSLTQPELLRIARDAFSPLQAQREIG